MSALLDQPTAEVVAARGQRVALRALRSLAYSMLIGLAIVGQLVRDLNGLINCLKTGGALVDVGLPEHPVN